MSAPYTFDDLVAVMARLRGPGGCPWDRAQTPRSLRPYLLEETYETLEAIDRGDGTALREELGDLLLQVVFQARMAEEAGGFTIGEVVDGLVRKLIDRHPHVFGDARLETAEAVLAHWHDAKQAKREAPFAGVPEALPALARAQKVQERVRALGFRWPDLQAAVAKARAELGELQTASDPEAAADELGDALFTLINVAIFHGVDAEQALRDATRKFVQRFTRLEALARATGRPLREHTLQELLALWEQAKSGHAGG
ncbi:MAG: nucleoside triphosphate pyrophosphohydrolase [Armatimonadota bacterium]|nr:nucleoside triphosphate pyrophosphohydrolase [Armatimonadota bacterium]MDR7426731.1 nucleoside triphosphate pyrophosphohydrolase [Armatimonadota bacterium]MDR7469282.1 nucleoside triphosphate pyrophosphohydrolase [Armatimonadota bacterium]MDR7475098.1 nucleoside triphosphate pyrophosphohydrolase [Armatimonadota bacterium]MDR7540286.1 nucleoside triphosphate pyrophosphohydrolase [Armatimonadota bacterium]